MVKIVKVRLRNVMQEVETRQLIDKNLGRSAGEELIIREKSRLEQNRRQIRGADFRRRDVLNASARGLRFRIHLDDHTLFGRLPFRKLSKDGSPKFSADNVEFSHLYGLNLDLAPFLV